MKIITILIFSIFITGCSSSNLLVHRSNSTMGKKYSISMANYAINNKKIFIRLADKTSPSIFATDTGQRFQIYFVADYHAKDGIKNLKAYSISARSLTETGFHNGNVVIRKIKLDGNKISASLEQKLEYNRGSLFFDFSNIEIKKVPYRALLAMDVEYDKSCVLNKNFSIYTNNKIVGKLCPKGDMPVYGVEPIEFNYLSFDVETYAPVKISDINKIKSIKKNFVNEKINQIYKILSTANLNADFDNKVVRLKMKMPDGEIIYIDRDGIVVRGDDFTQLNKENFKRLKYILNLDESNK